MMLTKTQTDLVADFLKVNLGETEQSVCTISLKSISALAETTLDRSQSSLVMSPFSLVPCSKTASKSIMYIALNFY